MASPNLKQCADQFSALSKEWGKGSSRNLEKCGKMLKELQLNLTALSFLPSQGANATMQVLRGTLWSYNASKLSHLQELTVCRNTLEIGAQYCVEKKDIPGFEKYMAQLQTYYLDYSEKEVGW